MKIKYLIGLVLLFLAPMCFANFEFSVINTTHDQLALTVKNQWWGNLYWNGQKIARGEQVQIPHFPGDTGLLFEASHYDRVTEILITLSTNALGENCLVYISRRSYKFLSLCKGFISGANHTIYYTGK